MSNNLHVVIMAGGIGTRFWPYSRNSLPKQFLDVLDTGRTLLQMTYDRFKKITTEDKIYIVSNQQYKEVIADQLPALSKDQILLEPVRRNTAPCIAYASYKILKNDPEAVMVVSPADHAIFNEGEFLGCIEAAAESAEEDERLITLGIQPTRPETGYGYIQFIDEGQSRVKKVKTFTEKPQLDLAQKFIESGDFVWNAGIFIWRAQSIVNAFKREMPELADVFEEGNKAYYTGDETAFVEKAYSQSKNISIDYGVMEKSPNVYVIHGDFGWSDLGSWNSLYEIHDKDEEGNVSRGNTLLYNCNGNLIKGKPDKLILMQDMQDYLIADFDDVLVICKRTEEAKFREFVADVKSKKGSDYL